MISLYYPPFDADDETDLLYQSTLACRRYVRVLSEFSSDVLEDGWNEAVCRHKVKRWPSIDEIREACLSKSAPKNDRHKTGKRRDYDMWESRLGGWIRVKMWLGGWGSPPNEHDTDVPQSLLDRYGIVKKPKPERSTAFPSAGVAALRKSVSEDDFNLHEDEKMSEKEKRRIREESIRRFGE